MALLQVSKHQKETGSTSSHLKHFIGAKIEILPDPMISLRLLRLAAAAGVEDVSQVRAEVRELLVAYRDRVCNAIILVANRENCVSFVPYGSVTGWLESCGRRPASRFNIASRTTVRVDLATGRSLQVYRLAKGTFLVSSAFRSLFAAGFTIE
eukprot:scaffold2402_cov286-Pinguiococcus_pyrenoidosus.AAC.3